MVLDKFKNFLKKDKDKSKGRERTVETIGDEGGPDRDLRRKNPDRRDRSGRRSRDLSMPSEEDLENLPDIPSAATERRGTGLRPRGRSSRSDTMPSRPKESPRKGGLRDTRRDSLGGPASRRPETRRRSLNSDEMFQRILDRLDDIDRRLDRVERRL